MDISYIKTQDLHPHERNQEFFSNIDGEDWDRLLKDIKENGIRDPLKVTSTNKIIGGEQRWRVATELGLEKVPCRVFTDLTEDDAVILLLKDNLNRRHLSTIEKAKIATALKEQWDIQRGKNNEEKKTISDIAEEIGENKRTTQRLLKLNDLIPELQALVENGKLSKTAGESLAHLQKDEQKALLTVLGEENLASQTSKETKDLRKAVEESRIDSEEDEQEVASRVSSSWEEQKKEYERQLSEERQKTSEAESKAQSAISMMNQLQAEQENDEGNELAEENEELRKNLNELAEQLHSYEEQVRTFEIQKAEAEATSGFSNNNDNVALAQWKQLSLLVKSITREHVYSPEIVEEAEKLVNHIKAFLSVGNKDG